MPTADDPRELRQDRGSAPRAASLRDHLLRMLLVAFLPLLLFSVAIVVLLAREQRATLRDGAIDRTLALITAIDTELNRSIAALEALATSEHLESGALRAFQTDAEQVLRSRPEWLTISLAEASGRQLVHLLRPFGSALPPIEERASFDEVVRTGRARTGNLFREPISNEYVFPVRVPVHASDGRVYVLSALVKPTVVKALLWPQGLPADWVGVVLDANDVIVARTVNPERMVGRPAAESLRAALAQAPQGWFHGTTIEGWDVYTPYNRSTFSGWAVALGIPAGTVQAPLRGSLLYLTSVGLGLLGLGVALAWLLSRRTARSIEALARMAEELGSGRTPTASDGRLLPAAVAEVEKLRTAFVHAAGLIRARSEERDRVESSLREVEAALRESDRRKDQFLAMLGHELRNPLGIIRNAVELLETRTAADPGAAELREMMERQVAYMTRLMDDLLDVSRIAQGRIHVNRKPCDLVSLVRETTSDHRAGLEKKGLTVEVELPDHPLWVAGDRTRLAQAVANLLANAGKFSNPGGRVMVRLAEASGGGEACLTIRDTGVGMEPEILEHAFQPFSQADRTIERSRGGLGLGLALVKGLVELHGGSVAARSEGSGSGAEFTIRLPLDPGAVSASRGEEARADGGRRHRILLVEDNPMAAKSMQMLLQERGHAVEVARSGPEGLEMARRVRPHVVLCDVGLPGQDGYHVARSLRDDPALGRVHLVAVTGYGQDADRRRAREAGFDDHLTKPVDLDALIQILDGVPAA